MTEKISDNVGKKIVEALRKQTQTQPEQDIEETEEKDIEPKVNETIEDFQQETSEEDYFLDQSVPEESDSMDIDVSPIVNANSQINIDSILQNTINQNMHTLNLQSDFEFPNNVAILSHLITKLPAGVTKQTGAIIIRQTMEALGIPMKSVLQEAQQVQETLALKTRECQKNIVDYRKQIATLELKSQHYQKQAVAMNDMINLFVNTGI